MSFILRCTKVWVTGWPLSEVICAAQPVGCLFSAKPSSSLGKIHAPFTMVWSSLLFKVLQVPMRLCGRQQKPLSYLLGLELHSLHHCASWERLRTINTQARPPASRLQVWGLAMHTEPCSRFRYLWGCKMAAACKNVGSFIFSSVFFRLLVFLLKSDKERPVLCSGRSLKPVRNAPSGVWPFKRNIWNLYFCVSRSGSQTVEKKVPLPCLPETTWAFSNSGVRARSRRASNSVGAGFFRCGSRSSASWPSSLSVEFCGELSTQESVITDWG